MCFESETILSVECVFKGMRVDHDMPTVANYAYRRASCVQDDMLRIHQKDFSYFAGPNSFYPEKIIKGEPPNIKKRQNKQSVISEGTGCKEENILRPTVLAAPSEECQDVTTACQVVDANVAAHGRTAVRHNSRGDISPFWVAVLLENVQIEVHGGNFLRQNMALQWLNQTSDPLTYTPGDVCNRNSPE